MGQENYSTKSRKGKHLTYEERIKVEALYKAGISEICIGVELSRNRRTIERELAKGMVEQLTSELKTYQTYSADVGQQTHDERATNKGPGLKIGKDHKLAKYLERSIKGGNSPYAALQGIENKGLDFSTTICVKTLYTYIDNGLFIGISNKDLIVKKNGKKRNYHNIRQAITNVKGTSIADRPLKIDDREEFGHWEMDTVVGKRGTKTVLLVLSERAMRKELIFKIKSRSQEQVTRTLDKLERKLGAEKFAEMFKTITCDNGGENLNYEGIEKSVFSEENRTKLYYAHPFSSWERGTNENINKMIRRHIPKGVDIADYSDEEIKRIENWINNYPRKILNGLSANMAMKKINAA